MPADFTRRSDRDLSSLFAQKRHERRKEEASKIDFRRLSIGQQKSRYVLERWQVYSSHEALLNIYGSDLSA